MFFQWFPINHVYIYIYRKIYHLILPTNIPFPLGCRNEVFHHLLLRGNGRGRRDVTWVGLIGFLEGKTNLHLWSHAPKLSQIHRCSFFSCCFLLIFKHPIIELGFSSGLFWGIFLVASSPSFSSGVMWGDRAQCDTKLQATSCPAANWKIGINLSEAQKCGRLEVFL